MQTAAAARRIKFDRTDGHTNTQTNIHYSFIYIDVSPLSKETISHLQSTYTSDKLVVANNFNTVVLDIIRTTQIVFDTIRGEMNNSSTG